MSKKRYSIYTDGGCRPNPGVGAAASILVLRGKIVDEVIIGKPMTTNNEMELMGLIKGLALAAQAIASNANKKIYIDFYCDSQLVLRGVKDWMYLWKSLGWKKGNGNPIKNVELWQCIYETVKYLKQTDVELTFNYVEAHSGDKFNTIVDKMCTKHIRG